MQTMKSREYWKEKIRTYYDMMIDAYHTQPKKFRGGVAMGCIVVWWVSAMMVMMNTWPNQHGAWGDFNLDDLLAWTDEAVEKQAMIDCLSKKWVSFYGWASCGFSCEDVSKYGKDMKNFSCIDCDINGSKREGIGVKELPLWRSADGKTAKDITSLNDLAAEYSCR